MFDLDALYDYAPVNSWGGRGVLIMELSFAVIRHSCSIEVRVAYSRDLIGQV